MQLFNNTAIDALQQTAVFAQNRHEVLAGNLANIDTPGYRSRDLDVDAFQDALATAIREPAVAPEAGSLGPANHGLSRVDAGGPVTRNDPMDGPRKASEQVVFHDDSDVSIEHQVTRVAANQRAMAVISRCDSIPCPMKRSR